MAIVRILDEQDLAAIALVGSVHSARGHPRQS